VERKRKRTIGSIRSELIVKSKEAAISAIKVFNDPLITFKGETFIVLMVIGWTYLLHAYYRSKGIEYRYYRRGPKRRIFDKTKRGSYKYWELERCLNDKHCPLDHGTANNLRFLIGLRHEIEHQTTRSLDTYLSGRYQACAMNYNDYLKKLFGKRHGIDRQLAYSIQFLEISEEQIRYRKHEEHIPKRLLTYIADFDGALTHEEYNNPRYSFRMLFKRKLVNRPGQADRVIEFIDPDSELAKTIDKEYWVKKEVERPKFRATEVVGAVNKAGFKKFRVNPEHVEMWKREDAKDTAKGYGTEIQGQWYWYENWIERCIELCRAAGDRYVEAKSDDQGTEPIGRKSVDLKIGDQPFVCVRLRDADLSSGRAVKVSLCVHEDRGWSVIEVSHYGRFISKSTLEEKKKQLLDHCPTRNVWVCTYKPHNTRNASRDIVRIESTVRKQFGII